MCKMGADGQGAGNKAGYVSGVSPARKRFRVATSGKEHSGWEDTLDLGLQVGERPPRVTGALLNERARSCESGRAGQLKARTELRPIRRSIRPRNGLHVQGRGPRQDLSQIGMLLRPLEVAEIGAQPD